MEIKICKTCQLNKPITEFYRDKKAKDKLRASCKDCLKEVNRRYHKANQEVINDRARKWALENKERAAENKRHWAKMNIDRVRESGRKHKAQNEEIIKQRKIDYAKNNPEKVKSAKRKYEKTNRLLINKRRRNRIKEDPVFKLADNVRGLIRQSIQRKSFKKGAKSRKILGCSYKEFAAHLNDNPYDFKGGDKELDLDHIIPVSRATTEKEILKLNHYTNFQLLPKKYNRNIKKDNDWDKDHFENWLKKVH